MARGAPGHGGEWQAARAPGARGRRRRRPSRAAPVGGALATRECGAAEPGGRAGEPAGARAGARLRTRVAVGRAARSSRGRRACCWHPARQAWAAFASGRGSPVPGRPGSPGLPPPPGTPRPGRRSGPAATAPSQRPLSARAARAGHRSADTRGRRWGPRRGGKDAKFKATRTSPPRAAGTAQSRLRPRGVHRPRRRWPCRRGCRRAPLCNVNFSGTNCLLIV